MKKILISICRISILLMLMPLLLMLTQCASAGKARYTKIITLNPATPVEGFQVMIRLQKSNFDVKMVQPDGSNIRFYDSDGNNLNFWIENWNPYGVSTIWVRAQAAGTEKIAIRCGEKDITTPGSDGTLVFDPVATWDVFKTGWLYSGIVPGRISGWENELTGFDIDVQKWKKVDIDSDYPDPADFCRWFVRKEFFIAQGEAAFSGVVHSDVIWTAIYPDELYKKIMGDEKDADGENPGNFACKIIIEKPFERLILAGRCQETTGKEEFKILQVIAGFDKMYMRKE